MSKNSTNILRIGLACVFLANALVAWFSPDEFQGLVEGSFLVKILPMVSSSAFVTLILINDGLLSLIFLFNPKFIKYALLWASVWIVAVMLVVWDPLDGLEHLGFLAMSIALFLELRHQS